jgi:hypothetical protein
MKTYFFVAVALACAVGVHAQDEPPEVMLFGVFHFANPGEDVIAVDQIDVSTPQNQTYLEGLAERLCAFKPTAILLEFHRDREPEVRRRLDSYLSGEIELGMNEIYQIGFRVAEACGVASLYGFDESEVGWRGDLLFEYLERSEPEMLEMLTEEIERVQDVEARAQRELGLRDLLLRTNDAEQDRLNKDFYLVTNAAGAGEGFEGADATARWWHRNIRMYANIQKHATAGERILVVAGQGHTAVLRDFLRIDGRILAHDVQPYL